MRLRHPGGRLVHLTHGGNLHPVRDLAGVVSQLDTYAVAVRDRLDVDVLGLSPWLPPALAAALAIDSRARRRLRSELSARGLEVVTLRGVPYQANGGPCAHRPDWATEQRLEYTLDLARILVDLLPDDAVRGSVSTSGLGGLAGWGDAQQRGAGRILGRLSGGLAEIAWHTGRAVRVGFQPEPGCVLDGTEQTIAGLAGSDKDLVGVCLDLANLACTWQDPGQALAAFAAAGVPVVKVQVAAAIQVTAPAAAAQALRGYVEPHHPHQVCTPTGGYLGELEDALRELPAGPWRVRYQVPLHTRPAAPLTATTQVWQTALRHLMAGDVPGCEHLDVTTETWDVLPAGERPAGPAAFVEGVATELAYARQQLETLGLTAAQRVHVAP